MAKSNVATGKALWAKVMEPDTKFDANGVYSVDLLIAEEEAQELVEYLENVINKTFDEEIKAKPKMKASLSKKAPYERDYDQDGNETGNLKFRFKLKAKGQTRDGREYTQQPVVVDAKRQPLDKSIAVGNGSLIKVAFDPMAYVMASTKQVGVSLRLKAVQVIDLVEYGNSAASMFDDEDGYVTQAVAKDNRAESNPWDEDAEDGVEGDF